MKNEKLAQRLLNLFYQNGFTDTEIEALLKNREKAHSSTASAYSRLVSDKTIEESRFELIDEINIDKEPINVDFFINNTMLAKSKYFPGGEPVYLKTIKSIRRFSQPGKIRVYNQKYNVDILDFIRFADRQEERLLGLPGIILFNEKTNIAPKRDLVISIDPSKKIIFTLDQKTFTRDVMYKHGENFIAKKMIQDNLFLSFVPAKYDT